MSQIQRVQGVATTTVDSNEILSVVYHSTEVVRVDKRQGFITLNSGGWKTNTTKTRMNQASNQHGLGYHVYQSDFVWYVSHNGRNLLFEDGIQLKL